MHNSLSTAVTALYMLKRNKNITKAKYSYSVGVKNLLLFEIILVIGHFRVPLGLCFKLSLGAKSFL